VRDASPKRERGVELPDDPSVVGEASPFFKIQDDPDFEATDRTASSVGEAASADTETPDEERSLSQSLIGMVKSLLGNLSPAPAPRVTRPSPAVSTERSPVVFPAERDTDFDSFDSVTDEETSRQVQEALARMERGETPFEDS